MNRKAKLLRKLFSVPKNFTFNDAETLLNLCGFTEINKGKTSGSRVEFIKDSLPIYLHRPHPQKELHHYQVKELQDKIKELINHG